MTSTFDPYHVPVLLSEVIRHLNIRRDGVYADFTAGGGSHSKAILEQLARGGHLFASDRDEEAVAETVANLETVHTEATWTVDQRTFSETVKALRASGIVLDGLLADLGVSSHQLDAAERGYSYHQDGPLDMRMDQRQTLTAADLVNEWSVERLSDIFSQYGEERHARRLAGAIVNRRQNKPFSDTLDLAKTIADAMPKASRREKQHPARRVFQALRIAVNDELGELERLLEAIPALMADGGRVSIITFHSLEDRLVKQAMSDWVNPCHCPRALPCTCGKKPLARFIDKGGITATEKELEENRRAKSARLRTVEIKKGVD
ncbi:MAG TPA: 16S rRNA (cytosine(1402)-N(4))-methyltransferase RsmH [Fastidiosipila sp.]|nr:16S rRNA (cytosine(1402)-N(4))-methyltransferase RsmH [Fastidiosipila sp.]